MRQGLHPLVSLRTITLHNHLVEQEGSAFTVSNSIQIESSNIKNIT